MRDILAEFKDAGLGSLPGGGAEIFHPEVRDKICEHKADADDWLRIHREAHQLGLRSNATMLYGHIEKPRHRIDHLIRLRELQDETGGFQTFIPLAFHPDNTKLDHIQKPSGIMDLRVMAISRLMLDNFPHVKAYWVMLGIKTAQTGAELRGRRHRRHGGPREDLPRRRQRLAAGVERRRPAPPDRGGGPGAGRTRHAVPRGRPRAGDDVEGGAVAAVADGVRYSFSRDPKGGRRFRMKEKRFWSLIEAAWQSVGGKVKDRQKLAAGELSEAKAGSHGVAGGGHPGADRLLDNLTAPELLEFDRILERKLYDIDRAEIQEYTDGSDDGFLYCRGFIVAAGAATTTW